MHSCLIKKESVNIVRLIRSPDIVTWSFQDFLKPGFHSFILSSIWKSSLCILLLQSWSDFF